MPRVSLTFFVTAALCGLAGMVWGSYMGATGDHTLFPAHAHLNLLGWVGLSIMGGFYAIAPRKPGRLAWINFGLSAGGAVIMAPMLGWLLSGHEAQLGPFMPIPEGLSILGLVAFLVSILRNWRAAPA